MTQLSADLKLFADGTYRSASYEAANKNLTALRETRDELQDKLNSLKGDERRKCAQSLRTAKNQLVEKLEERNRMQGDPNHYGYSEWVLVLNLIERLERELSDAEVEIGRFAKLIADNPADVAHTISSHMKKAVYREELIKAVYTIRRQFRIRITQTCLDESAHTSSPAGAILGAVNYVKEYWEEALTNGWHDWSSNPASTAAELCTQYAKSTLLHEWLGTMIEFLVFERDYVTIFNDISIDPNNIPVGKNHPYADWFYTDKENND